MFYTFRYFSSHNYYILYNDCKTSLIRNNTTQANTENTTFFVHQLMNGI